MTARPQLRLIRSCDIPAAPWWQHRIFLAREAAGTARWWLLRTALATVASAAMRERAWAEGFAVALGNRPARSWLQYLDAWMLGNETGHELRYQRHDRSVDGVRCLFRLPVVLPVVTAGAIMAAGRHAAPRPALPSWPRLAARWLRRVLPGLVPPGAHAPRTVQLRVAA